MAATFPVPVFMATNPSDTVTPPVDPLPSIVNELLAASKSNLVLKFELSTSHVNGV